MKKYFLALALMAVTALSVTSLRADDTNTMAAATNAVAAAAPATPAPLPPPTLDQRVSGLEAYIANSNPNASLLDTNGNQVTANTPVIGVAGPGHNAWMMTSTALVLFMTLPGLALFYGGMVRKKNVLSVLAQCFLITGIVTILWYLCGFSMAFGPGTGAHGPFWGDLGTYAFFKDVTGASGGVSTPWVSLDVFSIFQLTFAIITPALIIGSIAERMKFKAIFVFITLWMFVVYFPLAHMVWSGTGYMSGAANAAAKIKAIDFAGGTVVHMSSGWSAIVLCLILGKRIGFGKESFMPHNLVLTFIGTGMLWVGWYGFNAGSEVGADGTAGNAFTTTTLATAIASFVWPMWEWLTKGKPSLLGFCSGAVAGLVVITPACGWVNPTGSVIIGIAAGTIPWFMCYKVKGWLGYDDALDTFGVHAIGGTVGAIMTGMLCDTGINSLIPMKTAAGLADHSAQTIEQLKAVAVTIVLSVVGTIICAYITKVVVGLRPTEEVERAGLDESEHGELGYHN
jgi:Amt family ammonium transporter